MRSSKFRQGRGHNRKDVSSSSTQPHPHRSNAHNQQPHHQYGNGTVNNFPKHQQYHPQSVSGSTNIIQNTKINLQGYATVTASDVKRISVDSPEPRKNYRVVKNPHKQGAGPGGKVCNLKVQQVSTLANNPTLRNLEDGFNLEGIPPNWFCYSKVWNARNYAHELSSNFSSSKLCHEEDEGIGTVDFISDWKNIKTLLKSHLTDGHLSYFLQRVGNSVTLDHLDLLKIILFPDFRSNFPPEFIEFITKVIEKHEKKIKLEGRSNDEVLSKEAFHKLLHFSMDEPIKVINEKLSQACLGTETNFLRRHLISMEKLNMLVGSSVPLFTDSESFENTTLRAVDVSCGGSGSIKPVDAYDLWLDNMLLQCPKTRISYHKRGKISKTEWMNTDELPVVMKFDACHSLEVGLNLLELLKENVKVGHSYWLFRAPGSTEITLYNISNIRLEKTDSTSVPIFENWKLVDTPYLTSTLLMEYAKHFALAVSSKLQHDTVFEPGFGTKKNDHAVVSKFNELNKRLEVSFSAVQQQMSITDNRLIHNLDDISFLEIKRVVMCVKGIYDTALKLTPNMRNCIFAHAVERFFPECLKIIRSISPKVTNLKSEHLTYWEGNEATRKLIFGYMYGMCDILTCLSEWHTCVKGWPVEKDQRQEWMYLGCKLCVINADLYFALSARHYQIHLLRPPQLDQVLPIQPLNLAIKYYENALEQIPEEDHFQVKQCFVPPSDVNRISKADLANEINWKLSTAYLYASDYWVNNPSLGCSQPTQTLTDKKLRIVQFHTDYSELLVSLKCCMEHAEKVTCGKITNEEINERTALAKSSISKISKLVVSKDSAGLNNPTHPLMIDVAFEIETYQNKKGLNAIIVSPDEDSFVIQRSYADVEEVKHSVNFWKIAGAFNENGKLEQPPMHLLEMNMKRLTLGSEADPKP